MSAIDRLFIAANFDDKERFTQSARYLSRDDFLEVLVRIADEKYVQSKF